MINIKIECSPEITSYLNEYLQSKKLKISNQMGYQTLLIKEVQCLSDVLYLKKIKIDFNCHIICIVADEKYIFDIIGIHLVDIWRKKHIFEDCQSLLEIIQNMKEQKNKVIEFKSNMNTIVVDTRNIVYIESYAHYLTIHTTNASFRVREKISVMLKQLEKYGFIQIHKSYLINKNYIKSIHSNNCELSCGQTVPIGDKYRCIYLN